ncbi:MAG: aldo/keto reductase [Thermoanaerobaculia bacterium]
MIDRREALGLLAVGGWRLAGVTAGALTACADPANSSNTSPANRQPPTANPYPIGLGTWQTFDVSDPKPLSAVLETFVQLGGSVVDSSPMYGRSEAVVGELATSLGIREKLFVATKVWTSGRAQGIAQMEDSERKLRGKVDLMQVHNLLDADTHLETLRRWKSEGRIRFIGITHYTSSAYRDLEEHLRRGGIDFLQVNYSLAEREAEKRLLPLAKDRGVNVLINRPFGAGSLFRETRGKPLPSFSRDLGATSWAELFLKFVISHPAVTCAIPATSKVEHLRQNMNAGRGPMPDEAMRKRIADAV